jgi:hypothetical protein
MRVRSAEPAVVALPSEIELDGASLAYLDSTGPAYAALRAAVASGVPLVIADLTGTTFCDYPGFHQLVMIGRQAATGDVQLRVAMPADGSVRSWLEFLARHRLVRAYPGIEAAKTA